jgi:hypothetical protein
MTAGGLPPTRRIVTGSNTAGRSCILEDGETLMRAGDILIQRGTHHAWANRCKAIARIAFILIDGERAR